MTTASRPPQLATEYVTSPRLADLIEPYRGYLVGEQRRPQGIRSYVNHLKRFISWLGDDSTLADLTQKAVLRYKAQCGGGQAPSTIVQTLATLRDFAFWGAAAGHDITDPTLGIRRPRRRRPDPRPLYENEIADLMRSIAVPDGLTARQYFDWTRNRLMILVYLYTGARLTELAALRWAHILLEAGVIEIKNGKLGKDRTIPIHPTLARELAAVPAERRMPHMAIFQRRDGQAASPKSLCHIFNRWLPERLRDELGDGALHIHCHMLRATFANQLIINDTDLITTQELMGHANLDTLMHYVKSDIRRKRAGVERLPDMSAGQSPPAIPPPYVRPTEPPPVQTITCLQCGKTVINARNQPYRLYCTPKCGTNYRRAQRRSGQEGGVS